MNEIMKKFMAAFLAIICLASNAYASGPFIGADLLYATARHEAKGNVGAGAPQNGAVARDNDLSYGLNAGYRLNLLGVMLGAEAFYDNLNTSSRNFELLGSSSGGGDNIELENRYGGKINLGLTILPIVTPFISYGLSYNRYSSNVPSQGDSLSKSKLVPLYGIGFLFDLPAGVSIKASYDYQPFNMRYAGGGRIRTHLGVARLGLVYNF